MILRCTFLRISLLQWFSSVIIIAVWPWDTTRSPTWDILCHSTDTGHFNTYSVWHHSVRAIYIIDIKSCCIQHVSCHTEKGLRNASPNWPLRYLIQEVNLSIWLSQPNHHQTVQTALIFVIRIPSCSIRLKEKKHSPTTPSERMFWIQQHFIATTFLCMLQWRVINSFVIGIL